MNQQDAFLDAIRENPDDEELRLVFADWLEEQGDPRGELFRVQCEIEHAVERGGPSWEFLRSQELKLLRKHTRQWRGKLPARLPVGYERGMLEIEIDCFDYTRKPVLSWWEEHKSWLTRIEFTADVDEELQIALEHPILQNACWLELFDADLTPLGFEKLPTLQNLRVLGLLDLSLLGAAVFEHVAKLTKLKRLEIADADFDEKGLRHLGALQELRSLDLEDIGGRSLQHLRELKSLQRLHLVLRSASGKDFSPLTQLPSLSRLHIFAPKITGNALEQLAEIPSLRKLTLDADMSQQSLKNVGALHQVEDLAITVPTDPPDQWLQQLVRLPLRRLDLFSCHFRDQDLKPFARMDKLEYLNLHYAELNASALRHFRELSSLRELSLMGNNLTGKSIRHLTELPHLQVLNLRRTKVNDDAIPYLKDCPSLTLVDLRDTRVTKKAIQRLKRGRPQLTVFQ